ncbi:UNVERIFIED_CONTAM: hypothetical protein HDU68_011485 [Siphonaria sp. JEL0065]|nr:hypothetical protein HDU68_011485 [Siphonaria sp. JEL0065]
MTQPSTHFQDFPTEIIEIILTHLPIDKHLLSVALASKNLLAAFIFTSQAFANRHVYVQATAKTIDSSKLPKLSAIYQKAFYVQYHKLPSHLYWISIRYRYPLTLRLLLEEQRSAVVEEYKTNLPMSVRHSPDLLPLLIAASDQVSDETLLQDSLSSALMAATDIECLQSVTLLLQHPHTKADANHSYCLKKAAALRNLGLVVVLLKKPSVVAYGVYDPFVVACENRDWDIMSAILDGAGDRLDFINPRSWAPPSPLHLAIRNGDTEMMWFLLRHPNSNLAHHTIFRTAISYRRIDVITFFLNHAVYEPSIDSKNWAISYASEKNYQDIFMMLFERKEVDPFVFGVMGFDISVLRWEAIYGHSENVARLVRDTRVTTKHVIEAFSLASKGNHLETMKVLCADGRVGVIECNQALKSALDRGSVDIVKWLLETNSTSPYMMQRYDFSQAVKLWQVALVKFLLTGGNGLVQPNEYFPSEKNQGAIRAAYNHCKTKEMMSVLAMDERVDPGYSIIYFAEIGDWDGVGELLRKRPCVSRAAVPLAAEKGMSQLLSLLLELGYDPSVKKNRAIRKACEKGHLECVKLLLKNEQTNPDDKEGRALTVASIFGHVEVVIELLKDKRVDPSANNIPALFHRRDLFGGRKKEVVELLMADERVKVELETNVPFYDVLKLKK